MATEEAGSNPGPVAAQRPMQELFPVRRVLGMLQRNERLSEQSSPVATTKELDERQENPNLNNQPISYNEEIVSESPPSQADEASQELDVDKGESGGALSCPKCGKDFSSGTSLRTHLANVYPCDQPRPVMLPREGRMDSKTCFKCGKTFASWQGLRGHLNRIKPCDQEKPAPTTTRRRPAASRTCTKCGKTFSSPQSLRIHMNRVKPCDLDKRDLSMMPTTPPGSTPPTMPLMMNTEDLKKEAERKAKARYQARKAYLKKRGRLDELGDPPMGLYHSSDDHNGTENAAPNADLKRSAVDETSHGGESFELSNKGAKKQRVEEVLPQEDESADSPSDVSGLTQPNISTLSQVAPLKKTVTTGGSFVHRSSKGHGGDLLAGGCSCPPCVRRWARKLMNRMQQLEDEVLMLRQKQSDGVEIPNAGKDLTKTPTSQVRSDEANQDPSGHSLATSSSTLSRSTVVAEKKPTDIFKSLVNASSTVAVSRRPEHDTTNSPRSDTPPPPVDSDRYQQSPTASVLQRLGADKKSLMDAYTHANDQILVNERTVEESSGHVQILVGYNPATAMDFRRQVDELRESIRAEKSKRDITVAALIAHEWKSRRDEFKALLESAEAQNSPNDEQAYHTKWSDIANQVSMKDKVMSELERQMDSLGVSGGNNRSRYAEMGELSSRMAAEYAAKMALESEREGVYVGVVKSSSRIRSLVRNAIL